MSLLAIRGGHLIDPGAGIDGPKDILIKDGRIAEIASPGKLKLANGAESIDATGLTVAPGLIETAMTESLSPAVRARFLDAIPLGRTGTPEDVSGVVAFLCSDAARYITGQMIVIDGGMSAHVSLGG